MSEPQGLRALGSDSFSIADAVGGWRGLVESTAPGLVFVVVFVATRELVPAIVGSLAVTLVAVLARLLRRSSVTYALGGVLGVAIGAFWAWRSGEAENYYAWGLLTNAAFALAMAVSLAVRYPVVGLVAGSLGLTRRERAENADADAAAGSAAATDAEPVVDVEVATAAEPAPQGFADVVDLSWREVPDELRRYTLATWLWLAAFLLRLAVQVPLFLGGSVAWLGTARLVMGLPMWALVLWVTWLLVRPRARAGAPRPAAPTS
ncbi:uncharacterized protein DUF3159 [Salana multivorans]|uniref:Uncharacterized protein DUF3159 n=1 Tax=Salana multivorans TaxID=120377 RepID=A0A3N2D1L7_9MICO|nr:DUF3159 domain-containing protein [Salana multivorans]ROR93666.1 uncharacterized protein DUF3159 [Salana multivorans]